MKNKDILNLQDLFLEQLRDLYDGEMQQLKALPELLNYSDSFELKEIIEFHREETEIQARRLRKVFSIAGKAPEGEHCDGIKGLIREAMKLCKRCVTPEVRDAAIITSLQHINHYEIAGYGTAFAYAKQLKRHEQGMLLLESLWEEKDADMGLSEIAEEHINADARWSAIIEKAHQEYV